MSRNACLVVAPHPDDETIGAGVWIARNREREITVLHITDGSPRDMADARVCGFPSRRAYAAARRREAEEALLLAGCRRVRRFPFIDKETYLHLPELISRMCTLVRKLRPLLVLSPAYEGGHPDHDSAALAVAATASQFPGLFQHREYALYHSGAAGEFVTEAFLAGDTRVDVFHLSPADRDFKRAMLAKFETQQHIVNEFPLRVEQFRDAPSYDFTLPPHDGLLLYERWNWGISGAEWRLRAREVVLPKQFGVGTSDVVGGNFTRVE